MKEAIKTTMGLTFSLAIFLIMIMLGFYLISIGSKTIIDHFFNESEVVDGRIIEFVSKRSSKSGSASTLYAPRVMFEYQGDNYTIVGDASTSWDSYQKGESVEVRVDAENPSDSKVAMSWLSWVVSVFIVIGGIMFVVLPTLFLAVNVRGLIRWQILEHNLKKRGKKINLKITGFREEYVRDMGMTYYIESEYSDPRTGKIIKLENRRELKKDPRNVAKIGDSVSVVINPENPKQYYFELEKFE